LKKLETEDDEEESIVASKPADKKKKDIYMNETNRFSRLYCAH
jgi:carboxyl-terminal processing protease